MHRRGFLRGLITVPAFGLIALRTTGCGTADDASRTSAALAPGYKSFGYYQGLGPTQTRSASRPDGTYYDMPCIPAADVEAGEEKTYVFWHGHGAAKHRFTVTADDFAALAAGRAIEIHTSIVDGHRHALRISPSEGCQIA